MGTDNLHHKRKQAKITQEIRKQEFRKANELILIICEGTKTEPNYFKGFIDDFRFKSIHIDPTGTNTDKIVEKAIDKLDDYDEIWCVFDRDDFKKHHFNRAFDLARPHYPKIKIAYSNQAFEIWYLLHFNPYDSRWHRSLYKEKLSELLGHEYLKNSETMYSELLNLQKIAIKNAKKLMKNYPNPKPEQDNPSTTVYKLVEKLNKLAFYN